MTLALPRYVRVTRVARLTGLNLDRLRRVADQGKFAPRHLLDDIDYFELNELLGALPSLRLDPAREQSFQDYLQAQASGKPVRRRRAATEATTRESTAPFG